MVVRRASSAAASECLPEHVQIVLHVEEVRRVVALEVKREQLES